MRRRFLYIDILAAVIVIGGIAGVAVLALHHNSGPKPTPFPTQQITQAATPAPSPSSSPAELALGNWLTYGYDPARTRYNPAITSVHPPYHVKWHYPAGDLLEFPPSIYDGYLYFCTEHGLVICLKARNRALVWKYKLRPATLFATTPTVDAKSVYVTSLGGRFLVLDRVTGKPQWGLSGLGRSESSPLVWRDRVFFGDQDGSVYAMNISTHKLAWRYRTGGAVKGAPAELNGRLVVGSYDGSVYCLNYNGKLLWRARTGGLLSGNQFYATAALAYDTVYIGGIGGDIYAFSLSNGGLRWSFTTGGYVYSSPAVWGNLILEGSYDGDFYALNAANGRLVWRFATGAPISGSPTVLDGIVYVSNFGHHTWGLNARTGRAVWRFPDGRYSPATADRQTLYLNGVHTLYALVPKP